MASPSAAPSAAPPSGSPAVNGVGLAIAFAAVASLFFIFGFATSSIDALIPAVRSLYQLSYSEALLTQFAFFTAYGIFSLPAAAVVARRGYAVSIVTALSVMVLGCLLMSLATRADAYTGFLLSLFVLAGGVTLLQVAANPLVAGLGAPERSHFRLTLVQAFNSFGTVVAPYVGAVLILRGGIFAAGEGDAARADTLARIDSMFLGVAAAILAVAAVMFALRARILAAAREPEVSTGSPFAAFRSGWSLAGAGAIFLYVGAEISILSILINFLVQPSILGWSHEHAAKLLSLYGVGRMSGRFVGSFVMTRVPADRLLTLTAATAALLCLVVALSHGSVAAVAALVIGLFTSITFPTVFTITLERSDAPRPATSGLLVMAIVGGAIVPPATGLIADHAGLSAAFFLPAVAFAGVSLFAFAAARARLAAARPEPA